MEPNHGSALVQAKLHPGSIGTPVSASEIPGKDPGHKKLLVIEQHANGTYIIPVKPPRLSQLRTTRSEGTDIPAEMQAVLDRHNLYRCMHDVPLMTWDAEIATNAQEWAMVGQFTHSPKPRTVQSMSLGENLAWGYPSRSGIDAVAEWYDEIIYTDGTPDNCEDRTANKDICHYTQVVWSASTKLGCGKGSASLTFGENVYTGDYWVCQYGSAGNYLGQFASNVNAPVKTEAECAPPELEEGPTDPDCEDKAAEEMPVITYTDGSVAQCADLAWACAGYAYVTAKCKKTCNAC